MESMASQVPKVPKEMRALRARKVIVACRVILVRMDAPVRFVDHQVSLGLRVTRATEVSQVQLVCKDPVVRRVRMV